MVLDNPAILSDGVLKGVFRKYNTANGEVFETPDGKPFVLSEFGELDPKHYVTPGGEVMVVDHVAHTATKAAADAPKPTPGPLEATRVAVFAALKDYVDQTFHEGTTTCNVFETADGLVGVISGQKTNLRNYWSGKWFSEWHFDPKGKTASGKVRVRIHYFEDGNVSMEQSKDVPKAGVAGGDDKAFAEACRAFIAKVESEIAATLDDLYQNMSQETFKDMRRIRALLGVGGDLSSECEERTDARGVHSAHHAGEDRVVRSPGKTRVGHGQEQGAVNRTRAVTRGVGSGSRRREGGRHQGATVGFGCCGSPQVGGLWPPMWVWEVREGGRSPQATGCSCRSRAAYVGVGVASLRCVALRYALYHTMFHVRPRTTHHAFERNPRTDVDVGVVAFRFPAVGIVEKSGRAAHQRPQT